MLNIEAPRHSATRGWQAPWRLALLLLAALIPLLVSLALFGGFTGDDAYIHLVFARNLAAGQGFAFNPGEPTYGASSPLWVGLLAATSLVTPDIYWTARILGLACSVLAVIGVFLLAQRVTVQYWISLCAAVAFAIDPHFLKFAFSGMETSLAIFLVMLGLFLHMGDMARAKRGAGLSTWVLGLATLVRPECVLLFAVCLVERLWRMATPRRLALAAQMVGVYLLLVGPWWIFAWFAFGTLVPNTALAKSAPILSWQAIWNSVVDVLRLLVSSYGGVLLVFFLGWGGTLWRQGRVRTAMPRAAVLWVGIYLGALILKGVDVVARYFLLVSPVVLVVAFEGLARFLDPLPRINSSIILALCMVAVVLNSLFLMAILIYPAASEFNRGFQATYIEIGNWLAEHTPAEATVALADIGAVGYHGHRKVLDLGGLVTPEAIPFMWGNEGKFVELTRPDYLVIRQQGGTPSVEEWHIDCVQAREVLTRRFSAVGSRTLGVTQFATLYELTWVPGCPVD